MQIDTHNDQQVVSALHNASKIAIIPAKVSGADAFCAAVGIYHMVAALEKSAKILYPGKLPEQCEDLVSEEAILSVLTQRELTVSIDFSGELDAQAHYITEGDTLHVKLSPVSKDFDPNLRVRSKVGTGFGFDMVFVVGANEFADLGYVYRELEKEISTSIIVNISNSSKNTRFGSVNAIDTSAEKLSLAVLKKASDWELVVNKDSAKALLKGISL